MTAANLFIFNFDFSMKADSNSDLVRFLKSFAIIIVGIIVFDLIVGEGMGYLYKKQGSGLLYRTTYAVDSTKADYIVVGSSRASHHYDSKVFENCLQSSFYNCGRDQQNLIYSCAIISAITSRYSPKYIIIDILPNEFTQSAEGHLPALLPYYKNNAIRPYINFNSNFENIKLISKIYPYNSILTDIVMGFNKKWEKDYKGYIKLTRLNEGYHYKIVDSTNIVKEENTIDSAKIKVLSNLVDKLNKRHTPVLLVISPFPYKSVNPTTTNLCLSLCKKYSNLKFLSFTNMPAWFDDKYFFDNVHLNEKGATLFSQTIAKYIIADSKDKSASIVP